MAEVTFISHDGNEQTVTAEVGASLMVAATSNFIDGIPADCGGACSCATCHVYMQEPWAAMAGAPSDMETAMLEHVMDPRDTSRLSCQVIITDEMDGMRVEIPESQF